MQTVLMTSKRFWLKPFTPLPGNHSLDVVGRVSRERNLLTISYEILGALHQLTTAGEGNAAPDSVRNLGHNTCLLCFIAPANQSHYWEFKLAPDFNWIEDFSQSPGYSSGWDFQVSSNHNWQVSRYDSYHKGRHLEPSIKTISYSMLSTPKALHTLLKIDLEKMMLSDCELAIGVSAVTQLNHQDNHQDTIYWALNHPSSIPNFHHRSSFTLAI